MKTLIAFIIALFVGNLFTDHASAQPAPCQWNYALINNTATASYCGVIANQIGGVSAVSFGWSITGTDTTNAFALQQAINTAYAINNTGGVVTIPLGGNFKGPIYVPDGTTIICGGPNNPIIRTNIGPGFVPVNTPGQTFDAIPLNYIGFQNCNINGNGLAGTNILLYQPASWKFSNVNSYGGSTGAHFVSTGISNGTITVPGSSLVTTATSAAGQSILSLPNTTGLVFGEIVQDTTASVIPQGTYIQSISVGQITLSKAITGAGVGNGDTVTFSGFSGGTVRNGDMVICPGCGRSEAQVNASSTGSTLSFVTASFPTGIAVGDQIQNCAGSAIGAPCNGGSSALTGSAVFVGSISSIGGTTTVGLVSGTNSPVSITVTSGQTIAFTRNTFPTITGFAQGAGPAGTGTYTVNWGLTVTPNTAPPSGSTGVMPVVTATPWTWTNGPGTNCNAPAVYPKCTTTFPSAEVSLLGGVFGGSWDTGSVGNTPGSLSGPCVNNSAIAVYGDAVSSDGGGKPNGNTFINISIQCADGGVVFNNGSNNTFVQRDSEFVGIGLAFGMGANSASGNTDITPYPEAGIGDNAPQWVAVFDIGALGGAGPNSGGSANNRIIGQEPTPNSVVLADGFNQPYIYSFGVNGNAFSNTPNWNYGNTGCARWQAGSWGLADVNICRINSAELAVGDGTFQHENGQLDVGALNLGGNNIGNKSTFTPTITCGAGSVAGYTTQIGYYSYTGKIITVSIEVVASGVGTCTGTIAVSIPVQASAGIRQALSGLDFTAVATTPTLTPWIAGNGNSAQLRTIAGAAPTVTDDLVVTGSYHSN